VSVCGESSRVLKFPEYLQEEEERALEERRRKALAAEEAAERKAEETDLTLAARLRALEAKEVSVDQRAATVEAHAAKVEATKEQVAHMAAKLQALIHANTAAEEALQEERAALSREGQALSRERSALQDTLRQTERREEEAAALEASVREREDEVLRRQRALAEREADVVRTLEENQGWMQDKARQTQEAQRALDQAQLEVCEMRESKRTTEAALEAHANLVDALRQQLSAAEGRVQTMRKLDERARELGEREERLGLMADVIDDTAARREAEIDKLAQDADATQQRQLQLLAELEKDLKARSAALVAKDEEVLRKELLQAERERHLDERQRQLDNRSLSLDQAQDEISQRQRLFGEHQRGLAEQEREGKADLSRQQQVSLHVLPYSFTLPPGWWCARPRVLLWRRACSRLRTGARVQRLRTWAGADVASAWGA
jgi:hypothetical protein